MVCVRQWTPELNLIEAFAFTLALAAAFNSRPHPLTERQRICVSIKMCQGSCNRQLERQKGHEEVVERTVAE